jgi:hypothetical protein
MAETILVKEVLTDQMIAAGADLIKQLDRSGWPVVGSLWLYDPEMNEWRLLIVSPSVKDDGPLAAYQRINAQLESVAHLSWEPISVVSPDDRRVRALASAYKTGPDLQGRRVHRTAVNGYYVDDAYVYRLPPVAPAA